MIGCARSLFGPQSWGFWLPRRWPGSRLPSRSSLPNGEACVRGRWRPRTFSMRHARACVAIVHRGLVSGIAGDADTVAVERFPPYIAAHAGIRAVRAAGVAPGRGSGILVRSPLLDLRRHAHMVVPTRLSPDVAGLTAVRWRSRRLRGDESTYERAEQLGSHGGSRRGRRGLRSLWGRPRVGFSPDEGREFALERDQRPFPGDFIAPASWIGDSAFRRNA